MSSNSNLNGQGQSAFDAFTNSIRSNVVRGAQSLVNSWSECAYVLKYTRYTSYVVTVALVFVVLAVVFGWGKTIMLTIAIIAILCSAFQSYLVSQDSCFRVFRNAAP